METVMINEAVEVPSPGSVYGNYLVTILRTVWEEGRSASRATKVTRM